MASCQRTRGAVLKGNIAIGLYGQKKEHMSDERAPTLAPQLVVEDGRCAQSGVVVEEGTGDEVENEDDLAYEGAKGSAGEVSTGVKSGKALLTLGRQGQGRNLLDGYACESRH